MSECKFCGAELHDYRNFCNYMCKAEFEDCKADHYSDIGYSEEDVVKYWERSGHDEDIHFNLEEVKDDIPY